MSEGSDEVNCRSFFFFFNKTLKISEWLSHCLMTGGYFCLFSKNWAILVSVFSSYEVIEHNVVWLAFEK